MSLYCKCVALINWWPAAFITQMSCSRSLFGLRLLLALGFRLNRLFLIHVQTNWSLKAKDRKLHGPCELRYICLCFITSCSLHLELAIRSEVKWYIAYNFLPRKNNNLWVMSLISYLFIYFFIFYFLQVYWNYSLLSQPNWDDLFFSLGSLDF